MLLFCFPPFIPILFMFGVTPTLDKRHSPVNLGTMAGGQRVGEVKIASGLISYFKIKERQIQLLFSLSPPPLFLIEILHPPTNILGYTNAVLPKLYSEEI